MVMSQYVQERIGSIDFFQNVGYMTHVNNDILTSHFHPFQRRVEEGQKNGVPEALMT